MLKYCGAFVVAVILAQFCGVLGFSEGPSEEDIILQNLDKISDLLRSMLRQSGSQKNKLQDLNFSLKSLKYGLKSLEGDAATLADSFDTSEAQCLVLHFEETEQSLDTIAECVETAKETLQRIEGYVHGCDGGGWTPIAIHDFTDAEVSCPSGWQNNGYSIRGCGRSTFTSSSIDPVIFSVNGSEYNEVCGLVLANSFSIPRAFSGLGNIGDVYMNGVSLTHNGDGGQSHIWSFVASSVENPSNEDIDGQCPCDGGVVSPLAFVGEDYFCEAGVGAVSDVSASGNFHAADTLWDGEMCTTEICCTRGLPPYFHAYLDTPTQDDINARMMLTNNDDDVSISRIELYVRLVPRDNDDQ